MEIIKLGDLIQAKTGNMNKEDANELGFYNFYVRSEKILKANSWTFDSEGIIIPGEGIFKPLYARGKVAIHQRVYFINSKVNKLKNKYLYYWFVKNINLITKQATGSTVKSLRLPMFYKPVMTLPDLFIQQQIIDIIEPKESLFLKYKDLVRIENIEDFKSDWQTIIDIIEPFEKINKKVNSQIKKIDRFACKLTTILNKYIKIKDICNVWAGQSPPQLSKYWMNGKYPFININNLTNNIFCSKADSFMNELAFNKYNCKLTNDYSILVGKVSPDKNKISLTKSGFVVNGAIRVIESNHNNYGQIFFSLRNNAYKLTNLATGSVQQQINSEKLLNLEINYENKYNYIFNKLCSFIKNKSKIYFLTEKIIKSLIVIYIK